MSDFSDYMETAICNVMRGTGITAITPYIALFSVMPSEAGTGGTEVTTTVRPAGRLAIVFGAPSGGSMTNSSDVDFGTAAAGATVAGFGIYDASSSGNLIALKAFGSSQTILTGAAVKFASGALTFTVL